MSTVKADNFTWRTGEATANSQYTVTADKVVWGTAKSWVNFNGSGGASARASFNISSLTYTTTGQYAINFSVSMTDANYCPQNTGGPNNGSVGGVFGEAACNNSITSSRFQLAYITHVGSIVDTPYCFVAVFR